MPEFVVPPPLHPGDRVAIVAPSSGGARDAPRVLERGLGRLRDRFDLDPVVHPTARQDDEFLAAHPRARAAAVHDAFRDPRIRGVVATIGGDDQLRVLRHIDPTVLRANPTRFFGMSDNTNLELRLWNAGVVSYNGGQLMNQVAAPGPLTDYAEEYLRRAFFESSLGELRPAERWCDLTAGWGEYADADPEYVDHDGWRWTGGDDPVEGRLWGGCLAVVEWQLTTDRYLPDPARLDGTVLAVETAENLPSAERVGQTLMCLGERGLLERFDAALVGRPATQNWRETRTDAEREAYRERQREAVRAQFDRYNPDAPVVFDVDFGHTNPAVPLPLGAEVRVDPTTERIVCD